MSADATILVIGGSNSIAIGGWLAQFRKLAPRNWTIHNLAIGGTTSLMGLFRLDGVPDTDGPCHVIWEYALNEFGHFRQGGHPLPVLRRHVGMVMAECSRRGWHLHPVLFATRAQEKAAKSDNYRAALRKLFDASGLDYLDVGPHCRDLYGVDHLPDSDYKDNFHYTPEGRVVGEVARWLHARISTATTPFSVGEKASAFSRYVSELDGIARDLYRNRLVEMEVASFDQDITFTAPGDLLGLALVTSTNAGAVELLVDETRICRFSTRSLAEQTGPQRLVKQISLEGLLGRPVAAAGRQVTFRRAAATDDMLADLNFAAAIDPPEGVYDDALAGVILARP